MLSHLVNGNSCEILELSDEPDEALLHRALRSAMIRHPILNSRLSRRAGRAEWIRLEQPPEPNLRVERLHESDPEVVHRRLVSNIWDESLDPLSGPLARFHLTITPTGSWLQLVTHHIDSDARSGYRLAHDIAMAYTAFAEGREPETGELDVPNPPPDRAVLRNDHRGPLALTARALSFLVGDLWRGGKGLSLSGPRGATDVRKLDLGVERLRAVKRASRARGCTVHALLLTATTRACQEIERRSDKKPARVYPLLDLVSLRAHAGPEAMDLYDTMVVPVVHHMDGRLSDDALINAAAARIERLKSGDAVVELWRQRLYQWMAWPLPKVMATRFLTRLVVKGNIICSNPGPVPYAIEHLGEIRVRDFWSFSQLFPPGRVTFTFSTFRDELRLIMAYDQAAITSADVLDFANRIVKHLDRFAGEVSENVEPVGVALNEQA